MTAVDTRAMSVGVGLKLQHLNEALAHDASDGLWFEVHAENHMVDGGPRLACLHAVAQRFPLSIHGVGLSIAGPAPLDEQHLQRLCRLVQALQPQLVSEHMAWSFDGQTYFPDLLAPTRTTELLDHVCRRIDRIQEQLGRRIAIENATHYSKDPGHTLSEAQFWSRLVARTGCAVLLDINNALLSAHNLGLPEDEALSWLAALPQQAVTEIHLAGYLSDPEWGDALRIDHHGRHVAPETWAAYAQALRALGPVPTLIEWDNDVPDFQSLMAQRAHGLALWQHAQEAAHA